MIKDKDMPIKFQNNDAESGHILLKPILDYIKYLGKQISKQSISYFSEEDQCDVFVGIEGESIGENTAISTEEMGNGAQLKLILKVKPSQKGNTISPAAPTPANNIESKMKNEELISVSLPDLTSGTQVSKAIGNIIEPIKRERATRAEMFVKNN